MVEESPELLMERLSSILEKYNLGVARSNDAWLIYYADHFGTASLGYLRTTKEGLELDCSNDWRKKIVTLVKEAGITLANA